MATVAGGTAERLNGTGMFGEELKAQRTKREWTQVELGRKLGRYYPPGPGRWPSRPGVQPA